MMRLELRDGKIDPGLAPESWGFTLERFEEGSYLWREGGRILIAFIAARQRGRGHFSALVRAIEADGLRVAVCTPLYPMAQILERWGFQPHDEIDEVLGETVDVWERPPAAAAAEGGAR